MRKVLRLTLMSLILQVGFWGCGAGGTTEKLPEPISEKQYQKELEQLSPEQRKHVEQVRAIQLPALPGPPPAANPTQSPAMNQ